MRRCVGVSEFSKASRGIFTFARRYWIASLLSVNSLLAFSSFLSLA